MDGVSRKCSALADAANYNVNCRSIVSSVSGYQMIPSRTIIRQAILSVTPLNFFKIRLKSDVNRKPLMALYVLKRRFERVVFATDHSRYITNQTYHTT